MLKLQSLTGYALLAAVLSFSFVKAQNLHHAIHEIPNKTSISNTIYTAEKDLADYLGWSSFEEDYAEFESAHCALTIERDSHFSLTLKFVQSPNQVNCLKAGQKYLVFSFCEKDTQSFFPGGWICIQKIGQRKKVLAYLDTSLNLVLREVYYSPLVSETNSDLESLAHVENQRQNSINKTKVFYRKKLN